MPDKYEEEITRILGLLRAAAKENRYSIRSLERKQGVSGGLTRKVLNGNMTLTFRHVLSILDALGIEWSRFFHFAYPTEGKEVPEIEVKPALGDSEEASGSEEGPASKEEAKPAAAVAAGRPTITTAEFLVGLLQLLQQAGFDLLPKND